MSTKPHRPNWIIVAGLAVIVVGALYYWLTH